MLIGLLRTYLRPYRRELAIVVALQLVATMASLYLPSLNADIIHAHKFGSAAWAALLARSTRTPRSRLANRCLRSVTSYQT